MSYIEQKINTNQLKTDLLFNNIPKGDNVVLINHKNLVYNADCEVIDEITLTTSTKDQIYNASDPNYQLYRFLHSGKISSNKDAPNTLHGSDPVYLVCSSSSTRSYTYLKRCSDDETVASVEWRESYYAYYQSDGLTHHIQVFEFNF